MAKKNVVRRNLNRTRNKVEDGWENTKDKFEEIEDSTERYIKKNPLKSVLIAAGIGALIGVGIAMGIESKKAQRRRHNFWNKYNPFG